MDLFTGSGESGRTLINAGSNSIPVLDPIREPREFTVSLSGFVADDDVYETGDYALIRVHQDWTPLNGASHTVKLWRQIRRDADANPHIPQIQLPAPTDSAWADVGGDIYKSINFYAEGIEPYIGDIEEWKTYEPDHPDFGTTTGNIVPDSDKDLPKGLHLAVYQCTLETVVISGDLNEISSITIDGAVADENCDADGLVYGVLTAPAVTGIVETGDDNNQLSGYGSITEVDTYADSDAKLYFSVVDEGGGNWRVDVYRDSGRTDLTASTGTITAAGTHTLIPVADGGVGGSITVDALVAADADISAQWERYVVKIYSDAAKATLAAYALISGSTGSGTWITTTDGAGITGSVAIDYSSGFSNAVIQASIQQWRTRMTITGSPARYLWPDLRDSDSFAPDGTGDIIVEWVVDSWDHPDVASTTRKLVTYADTDTWTVSDSCTGTFTCTKGDYFGEGPFTASTTGLRDLFVEHPATGATSSLDLASGNGSLTDVYQAGRGSNPHYWGPLYYANYDTPGSDGLINIEWYDYNDSARVRFRGASYIDFWVGVPNAGDYTSHYDPWTVTTTKTYTVSVTGTGTREFIEHTVTMSITETGTRACAVIPVPDASGNLAAAQVFPALPHNPVISARTASGTSLVSLRSPDTHTRTFNASDNPGRPIAWNITLSGGQAYTDVSLVDADGNDARLTCDLTDIDARTIVCYASSGSHRIDEIDLTDLGNPLITHTVTRVSTGGQGRLRVYGVVVTEVLDTYNQISGMSGITGASSGGVYFSMVDDGGGSWHVNLYSDAARTLLIAHTGSVTAPGEAALTADNGSGLGGSITIDTLTTADATIEGIAAPGIRPDGLAASFVQQSGTSAPATPTMTAIDLLDLQFSEARAGLATGSALLSFGTISAYIDAVPDMWFTGMTTGSLYATLDGAKSYPLCSYAITPASSPTYGVYADYVEVTP